LDELGISFGVEIRQDLDGFVQSLDGVHVVLDVLLARILILIAHLRQRLERRILVIDLALLLRDFLLLHPEELM